MAVGRSPWRPASALFATRVVYAFNWYDVGAVLPLVRTGLGAGPVSLGIILAAFLVGVGLFQIPAGLAVVRFGNRNVSLWGVAAMGAATLASGFSPTWPVLAATRFLAGVGAAFFFAPALGLIASYFPAGQRGPVIGLYNGGFSVGGSFGLLAGAAVGAMLGWGWALSIGGALLLGTAGLCALVLPDEPVERPRAGFRETWASGLRVLRSPSIWALSLALTGFWAAMYDVAQYFVVYARTVHPSWGYGLAAALTGLVVFMSFPTGPLGGWIAEHGGDRRRLAALFAAATSVAVLAIPLASLATIGPLLVAIGGLDGIVFAIMYLIPTYLPEAGDRGLALGVGLLNSIQVMIGSLLAVLFAVIYASYGFGAAWEFAAVVSLGLLPLLLLVAPSRPDPVVPVVSGALR